MKFTSDNPWLPIECSIKQEYSDGYGKTPKPFTYWTVIWTNEFYPPPGIKLQLLHEPTGRKTIINSSPYIQCEDGKIVTLEWTRRKWDDPKVLYDPVDVLIRIEDKKYQRYIKVCEILQVGDFVKCEGTRSGNWNKVDSIDFETDTLFGPKYMRPADGYIRYVSSENTLSKVANIVRDGKELL